MYYTDFVYGSSGLVDHRGSFVFALDVVLCIMLLKHKVTDKGIQVYVGVGKDITNNDV